MLPEQIRVSLEAGAGSTTGHGMLIGFETGNGIQGIVIVEDGSIVRVPVSMFTIDWRYDAATDRWMDLEALRSAEPDQT
jgi:hypothetical protein